MVYLVGSKSAKRVTCQKKKNGYMVYNLKDFIVPIFATIHGFSVETEIYYLYDYDSKQFKLLF